MSFQKMVNMARTPEEVKKEVADYGAPVHTLDGKPSVPTYPYGLCIRLTEEDLAKLKIDGDLPEIGDTIHLIAMARVTSVSANERESTDGAKSRSVCIELQITDLGCENENEEDAAVERSEARRGRFYGDSAEPDEDDA